MRCDLVAVNSENGDLRRSAELSGTVARFERQPLMYATSKPTERTIPTAHSVYSQDRRICCVFINSQGAHSVKSPVVRKQKLEIQIETLQHMAAL